MIFGDLKTVLRVSIPVIVVLAAAIAIFGGTMVTVSDFPADGLALPSLGLMSLFFVAYILAILWMAVAWHRYCLLAEYPGAFLPNFHGDRIAAYFGRMLMLVLIAMVIGGLGSFVIGLVIGTGSGSFGVVGGALGLTGMLALIWAFQRLSIILPAAAIGEPLTLGEAWAATAPLSMPIIGVLVLLLLFSLAMGLAVGALTLIHPAIGMLGNLIMSWLQTVLGLSILTTLYGVAVQGRDID
ncbi:hypothetical protein VK792_05295 [Mesobacterium sp. TK19101]|uniref:Uncharacterized protein n=1 Tax=Mesobacterium hydrothermale TaxID=3111907 RepID=A0ABU6HFE1_9RHOB|nr:hypothetical protein [Mesobacterium sp. TK19101]MEC3860691.1 hypothetical protein [Mesobacterium sp. TK19101]